MYPFGIRIASMISSNICYKFYDSKGGLTLWRWSPVQQTFFHKWFLQAACQFEHGLQLTFLHNWGMPVDCPVIFYYSWKPLFRALNQLTHQQLSEAPLELWSPLTCTAARYGGWALLLGGSSVAVWSTVPGCQQTEKLNARVDKTSPFWHSVLGWSSCSPVYFAANF